MNADLASVARALRHKVEGLKRAGVRQYARSGARALSRSTEAQPLSGDSGTGKELDSGARAVTPPIDDAAVPAAQAGSAGEERASRLQEVAREVAACTRCEVLARCRKQTVFGTGSPQAALCFVGEAPGAEEDQQGEPFVGAAGQLLTKIIAAMGLDRRDVYICNVLKCRPPDNRPPLPDEVSNCRGFLDRQLAIIQPRYLCALGAVAARTLLDTTQSIGRLRGRFHQYRGIPVLCTYHPAYLLRTPEAKRDVWEDMQILMRELGLSGRSQ